MKWGDGHICFIQYNCIITFMVCLGKWRKGLRKGSPRLCRGVKDNLTEEEALGGSRLGSNRGKVWQVKIRSRQMEQNVQNLRARENIVTCSESYK